MLQLLQDGAKCHRIFDFPPGSTGFQYLSSLSIYKEELSSVGWLFTWPLISLGCPIKLSCVVKIERNGIRSPMPQSQGNINLPKCFCWFMATLTTLSRSLYSRRRTLVACSDIQRMSHTSPFDIPEIQVESTKGYSSMPLCRFIWPGNTSSHPVSTTTLGDWSSLLKRLLTWISLYIAVRYVRWNTATEWSILDSDGY